MSIPARRADLIRARWPQRVVDAFRGPALIELHAGAVLPHSEDRCTIDQVARAVGLVDGSDHSLADRIRVGPDGYGQRFELAFLLGLTVTELESAQGWRPAPRSLHRATD